MRAGKTFYWASTVKAPYLTKEETDLIVNELKRKYGVDGGK
jgi:hypothetical protein